MNIGIVGNGLVGSTAAYAIIMRGLGRKIVLVDKDKKRSLAETNDLLHAIPFANPLTVRQGNYEDLADCKLVVIAAGVSQRKGESRLDLLKRNADVFAKVIPAILTVAPESILVIATNPLDVMTYIATRFAADSGVPTTRVLGTGTMLDTARFRSLLGAVLDIDPQHVHGDVADVSISLPNVVGGNGILETLPLPLNTEESAELKRSAEILKTEIEKININ